MKEQRTITRGGHSRPRLTTAGAGSSGNLVAAEAFLLPQGEGEDEVDAQRHVLLKTLFSFLLLLIALGTPSRSMAQLGPDIPLQFKIIGQFYSLEKGKDVGGVHSFTVNLLKTTRILNIESSHTLEGTMLGSSVLRQIYPPIMTFIGPEALLAPLANPENEGKTYTLTGQLYVKRRLFQVRQVQGPGEEEGQPEPGAQPESNDTAEPSAQ